MISLYLHPETPEHCSSSWWSEGPSEFDPSALVRKGPSWVSVLRYIIGVQPEKLH